ncbi:hypothetical protein GCM10010981_40160 [Dyella nitratireducens]|uniref:Uncharacterized protein n=1 Tax=Dyella nitratireducens TaxID=1849580 RepID=A0ABQ1GMS4_9GAMM|nr:hypothetical protein GCM10010981_40160 [Dyella nitratireducens]GLQ41518.1 hypothetical protein GCM10007902_13680 [Dyella nitratireducens]
MFGTSIAEALYAGFDGAQPETFVDVRLKGMSHDVRTIQFDAWAMRGAAEFGGIRWVIEGMGNAMHGRIMAQEAVRTSAH